MSGYGSTLSKLQAGYVEQKHVDDTSGEGVCICVKCGATGHEDHCPETGATARGYPAYRGYQPRGRPPQAQPQPRRGGETGHPDDSSSGDGATGRDEDHSPETGASTAYRGFQPRGRPPQPQPHPRQAGDDVATPGGHARDPDEIRKTYKKGSIHFGCIQQMRSGNGHKFICHNTKVHPGGVCFNYSGEDGFVLAKYIKWDGERMPIIKVEQYLGPVDNPLALEYGLLFENNFNPHLSRFGRSIENVNVPSFKKHLTEFGFRYLADIVFDICDDEVTMEDVCSRVDFRERCVITIDDINTRIMDDALSCRLLPDGNYEVGIHIADVTNCISAGSELDKLLYRRGLTYHLCSGPVPMMGDKLSSHFSLDAGKDKLTISVLCVINKDGEVKDKWIGRTVINSCYKMNYSLAQQILDTADIKDCEQLDGWKYPVAKPHTKDEVIRVIKDLNMIANVLRAKRGKSGSSGANTTVKIILDEGGNPVIGVDTRPEEEEARNLVEEFMVFANGEVANRIKDHFPHNALLSYAPPYEEEDLLDLKKLLETAGLGDLDLNDVNKSFERIAASVNHETHADAVVWQWLWRCSKGGGYVVSDESSIPHREFGFFYTSFTSPIRRYADIVVHRLLCDCLDDKKEAQYNVEQLRSIADHLNERKKSSKSCEIYDTNYNLWRLIRQRTEDGNKCICKAIVSDIGRDTVDVFIPELNKSGFINLGYDSSPAGRGTARRNERAMRELRVELLKEVDVSVSTHPEFRSYLSFRYNFYIPPAH